MSKKTDANSKVRLFQLYLLSFMRVSPLSLSRALQQLSSTEAELEAVRTSMRGRAFQMIGGPDIDFYYEMLGRPTSDELIDNNKLTSGFYSSREFRYKLPLWPDFDYVVKVLPDGGTFDASFRRSLTAKAPSLDSFIDLQPWKFVKEEVDARFGSAQLGDAWDNWEELYYMIPKTQGEPPQKCFLLFDFNLLQSAVDAFALSPNQEMTGSKMK